MGRLDVFSDLIRWGFDLLGVTPRPWMGAVALIASAGLVTPWIARNARTSQARQRVRRLRDLPLEARRDAAAAILDLVRGNVHGLVTVVEAAHAAGQGALARAALDELHATAGAPPRDLTRLDTLLEGPRPAHPLAEVAAIERLVEAGAQDAARARCLRALRAFPGDPGLLAWWTRLDGPPPPPHG